MQALRGVQDGISVSDNFILLVVADGCSRTEAKIAACVEEYREQGIVKANEATTTRTVADEFDRYCKQERVETDAPIEWWQTTGYQLYPRLAQMAIDILSIPPMSDEPERIFSRLGEMITKRRNRLQQDIIQATTCLHSWDKEGLINMRNPAPACT